MTSRHIIVFITAPTPDEAERLSRGLVEEKLAYCVNAIPAIKSVYFWDGKVCVDEEIQLLAKTNSSRFAALEKWVREAHSYDVPEIIALPLVEGSESYLKCIDDWVQNE